jgi:hypothetical protein
MRERGQASVETVALIAVALAVAAALLLGVVRFAPPLAATLAQTLSGILAPSAPTAPGLDGLESALLAAATSPDSEGPTLLDVRAHLRSRLGQAAGDGAFSAVVRPLVERALPSSAAHLEIQSIDVTDTATEAAWLRSRFHPSWSLGASQTVLGLLGPPGAIYALADAFGIAGGELPDALAPGAGAGDVVVTLAGGRVLALRRRPSSGLTVVGDARTSPRVGVQ